MCPYKLNLTADRTTSKEAAAAAADHDVLLALYPDQQGSLDETLAAMLTGVDDGEPKANGIDLGNRPATAIIALRANDGIDAQEAYRPHTTPGVSNDPIRVLHCWSPYSVGDEEWLAIPARCPAGPHLRDMDKRCQRDS